jgi:hypothetical protein
MTGKEFLNAVANGKMDVIELLLSLLESTSADYCVIGGLAVNAYAEPVVSLDLDIVVQSDSVHDLVSAASAAGMRVEEYAHSINLTAAGSDLRIRVQTDPRYQEFVPRAEPRQLLGYTLIVACLEDVVRGKVWAYSDERRRKSKRQKDLADILRLVEAHPTVRGFLHPDLLKLVD